MGHVIKGVSVAVLVLTASVGSASKRADIVCSPSDYNDVQFNDCHFQVSCEFCFVLR